MSFIKNDNKFVSLSDKTASGTPNQGTTFSTSKQAIRFALWPGVEIPHLVNES